MFWQMGQVLTAATAGTKCYYGFQDLIAPTITMTMSAWDYTGWKGELWNGPTVGTATLHATLTPTSPSYATSASPYSTWWLKMISTGPGNVTITRT